MSLLLSLASSFSRSLSSFSTSNSKSSPSPRSSSDFDGAVGLGIVAAMTAAPPPRSEPLPILSVAAATAAKMMTRSVFIPNRKQEEEEDEDEEEYSWSSSMEIDETSESYTCVTSYVGGRAVSRTVYMDDGESFQVTPPPISISNWKPKSKAPAFFIASPPPPPPPTRLGEDFLRACHFCKRSLHRRDIFMYRGEIPFCRKECRYQYVLNEQNRDSWVLEALKLSDRVPPPLRSAGRNAA